MEEINVENESFVERLNKYEVNNIINFLFDGRFTDVVNSKFSPRNDVKNLEDFVYDPMGRVIWGKYYKDDRALRVYVLDQYDNFKVNTILLYDHKIVLPHFVDIENNTKYQDKYKACLATIFGKEYKEFMKKELELKI